MPAAEAVRIAAPPAPAPEEERIPTGRILVYSAPVLGLFSGGALISMYLLKFATDVLLIAPATIGAIFLAGRIWDAVSDPLVGTLSDRTRTRLGRRRPWMLASALPLGLSIAALWSPPRALEAGRLVAWVGVSFLLFYTFYTTFRVPHMALGAELSRGYHDRTRVFGVMQAVESVGMILGASRSSPSPWCWPPPQRCASGGSSSSAAARAPGGPSATSSATPTPAC